MGEPDYIVVGSGINGLVCAAMLALRDRRVLVLERNDRIGGCIRTDAVTQPGFVHDVMAMTFVLFTTSPAYRTLGPELERRGVRFVTSEQPTAVLRPDGKALVLSRSRSTNRAAFDALGEQDGSAFDDDMRRLGGDADLVFGLLGGSLWSSQTRKLLFTEFRRRGTRGLARFVGEALVTGRAYLEATYRDPLVRDLLAPWALHTGLTPESAFAGEMLRVIAFTLEQAGAPIVAGGAQKLLDAFASLIADKGGRIQTGADVVAVERHHWGHATGVRLADGRGIATRGGVICSVSPDKLYRGLLGGRDLPEGVLDDVRRYRYGRGNMQIHYALSSPPRWKTPALEKVALVHVTPGLDGVSKATNEAERGMLPETPTICVGQPSATDPTRAPAGQAVLWLQLPEAPRVLKGDAAGAIAIPADGRWTPAVRDAFADRVQAILAEHIEDFGATILGRAVYSPADLEELNVNLVGGDPYGGFCGLDQSLLWRPLKTSVNHTTPVPGLYHIGAATHPGAGLSGGSGYLLANSLR